MGQYNYGERGASDRAIAAILTTSIMPPEIVSERTQNTHAVGAFIMLDHLSSGEWDLSSEHTAPFIQEFLGGVIANAQRQGIAITTALVEAPQT